MPAMKRSATFTSFVLLSLALPAFAQHPRLEPGPATLLSSSPIYTAASGAQRIGTAVPTDAGWIAVWTDDIPQTLQAPHRTRLLASRLLPNGTARDTIGIRLASDIDSTRFTAVPIPGGVRVYWASAGSAGFAVQTTTVSDDGEVSESVMVGEYPSDATSATLSAAVSGSRTALLLHRYVLILEGTRLLKTVDVGGFGDPSSIVAVGPTFVASWVAAGDILMRQTLDLDGNIVGPAGGTGVAAPGRPHDLATDGSKALFVWNDTMSIRLGLFDPATGQFVEKGTIDSEYARPRAVWIGSSYLVAWVRNPGDLLGVHVSREGELLDAQPLKLFGGDLPDFNLVARGSQPMLLRQTGGCIRFNCETDVIASPLGGEPTEDHLISAAARVQSKPLVASDGRDFLVLWREDRQLYLTEMGERSRMPGAPVELGDLPGVAPVLASDGTGYLAAWVGERNGSYLIEGRLVNPDGETLTMKPFSFEGGDEHNVAAGAAPLTYLVSWRTGNENKAVRVRADGEVLDMVPATLLYDPYTRTAPSIAFDGDDFIVDWSSQDGPSGPLSRVTTIRVSLDGIPRFDRIWLSSTERAVRESSVGCADGTCLIVWSEQTPDPTNRWRVVGQRFRRGGALIDALPFDIDAGDLMPTGPSVAWHGRMFVVTWTKYIADGTPERVEARMIPASGAVEPGSPDLVVVRDNVYTSPVTACNREGRCVIVGPGFVDDDVLGRTTRLFKRFFGEPRHRAVRR